MSTHYRGRLQALVVLLAAAFLLLSLPAACRGPAPTPTAGQELLLAMLDVGQADSVLLRSPAGRTMLIDAGNEAADVNRVILPFLKARGITSLDYLVLTHPDQDHVGGMPALLDAFPVGSFVDSVQPGITNQSYLHTLQRVQGKGIKPVKARRGQPALELGASTEVQVLAPEEPLIGGSSPTNNNSIVLRVTYGGVSALLTGDMEHEEEQRLLDHRDDLRSQILKVAHHGSQGTTSSEFLDAVNPEVALISVGAGNSYGHPHRQLLQRLESRRLKSYRTDLNGTIQLLIDGSDFRVSTEKQGG
ncbi:MAG: MBL fold metallo-hydrolase [Bacteroidetes bacterium]|nr:MBL fold metallo-hydrolase [Bacteroidota bacterium]